MNGHRSEAEPGGKGQYDVYVDDELVFSKRDAGRFPEPAEILSRLG
jgi:selT/selW/selH-like putative selenoprotein